MPYYGAQHDLDQLITTHLFVLSPNNSGSTFVKNALATCNQTWNLRREGQHAFGFSGPNPLNMDLPLLWATDSEVLQTLADPSNYDWEQNKQTWYFQSFAKSPTASVFVEKSPPFLLHMKALRQHFANAKFIVMTRHPFAVAEGILRGTNRTHQDGARKAAAHIIQTLRFQKDNLTAADSPVVHLAYEHLCEQPLSARDEILQLVPELTDLNFDQQIPVKGNYNERLRNLNDQQIARLSGAEIATLETYFSDHQDILSFFGYPASL